MHPSARQVGITAMLFVGILRKMILRFTAYDAVRKAETHPSHVEHLIKQLTDLRKTSLAMVCVSILGPPLRMLSVVPHVVVRPDGVRPLCFVSTCISATDATAQVIYQ